MAFETNSYSHFVNYGFRKKKDGRDLWEYEYILVEIENFITIIKTELLNN